MQITFIRHLPTEWNKRTWLQGRRDIGISPIHHKEMEDILANKKHIESLAPFDLVAASSLKRTQQTALLYGYDPEVEHLLDELDFGSFEGVPKKKLLEEFGSRWKDDPIGITLGESIQNLEKRIISFIDKYQGCRNILVFGHGAWIRAAISYQKYGNLNHMNKMEVNNNDCLTIDFSHRFMKQA